MLEIKNLTYTVIDENTGMENRIIDDISLTINDRFVAITGPNGGGKSTLAKLIAGIITPDCGQIILDGVDITNMNITEIAVRLGYNAVCGFNKIFAASLKMSPSAYRKKYK